MNTVKNLISNARKNLEGLYNDQEATSLIAIVFNHYFGWNKADLLLNLEMTLDGDSLSGVNESFEKLFKGIPVQYITGESFFAGVTLAVKPGVLIPRPETEELVSMIISDNIHRKYTRLNILDIGTGSGCIAVSLGLAFRDAVIDATDVSEVALEVAAENARKNNLSVRLLPLSVLQKSMMDTLQGYDIVVSNPPYVTESEKAVMHRNVTEHEPALALFVPDNDPLMFYRPAAEFAFRHLLRPGLIYFEINERFGSEVKKMLLELGFEKAEVIKDMFGKDRFVRAEARSQMMDSSYWMVDKTLP